jgi:hypothetical protein
MPQITGSCVCGQLRYTAQAEPIFSAVCHCKTCQKQTGTAFRVVHRGATGGSIDTGLAEDLHQDRR